MLTEELFFQCPYCWETISMVFETKQVMTDYIEDCEVCCRPININYKPSTDGEYSLEVSSINE